MDGISEVKVVPKLNSSGEKHRMFQPNDIVRHFKGNLYRIVCFARNTEDLHLEVVYESLYPSEDGTRKIWTRDYDEFISLVDREKYPNADQEYRVEIVELQNMTRE